MDGVTVYGHPRECRVTFGRGEPRIFGKMPIPTIELFRDDFKRYFTYPCPRSLLECRTALRIKHS